MNRVTRERSTVLLAMLCSGGAAWATGPYGSAVVGFNPGAGANANYADPNAALGEPARFTGEDPYAGVVSMFNPPYNADQIVSVGETGSLTLRLGTPATNDPSHLYGADLIVFGYSFFVETNYPNGQIGNPAAFYGADPMRISVSSDGSTYVPLAPSYSEGQFPTQGYQDSGPWDAAPGLVPTDFTKPMNPALTLASFNGLNYAQALALYDGSGGGTPIDISSSGLSSVQYVRIEVPDDGDPFHDASIQVDGVSVVPEPNGLLILAVGALGRIRRGRG